MRERHEEIRKKYGKLAELQAHVCLFHTNMYRRCCAL